MSQSAKIDTSSASSSNKLGDLRDFVKEHPSSLYVAMLGGAVFSLMMGAIVIHTALAFLVLLLVTPVFIMMGLKKKTEEEQMRSKALIASGKDQWLKVYVNNIEAGAIQESHYHSLRSSVRLNFHVWLKSFTKVMVFGIFASAFMLVTLFFLLFLNDHAFYLELVKGLFVGDVTASSMIPYKLSNVDFVLLFGSGFVFYLLSMNDPMPFETEMNYRIRKFIGCTSLGTVEVKAQTLSAVNPNSNFTQSRYQGLTS